MTKLATLPRHVHVHVKASLCAASFNTASSIAPSPALVREDLRRQHRELLLASSWDDPQARHLRKLIAT